MNTPILAYRGRNVTAADLDRIRALLAAHPELSRRVFSQRLCEHWDWRQPSGALRDMVARSLLLALHRAEKIGDRPRFPAVRRAPIRLQQTLGSVARPEPDGRVVSDAPTFQRP